MNNDNDRSEHIWSDQDESEAPRSFREAYLRAVNPHQPRPRASNLPQEKTPDPAERPSSRPRARNAPGSGRIYEEGDQRPGRPRPTRQSREEVYARLRQRPRQPVYTREQDETQSRPPAREKVREPASDHRAPGEANPSYRAGRRAAARAPRRPATGSANRPGSRAIEYEEYDVYEVSEVSGRSRQARPRPRQHRGRRALSIVLTGCLGGIITLVVVAAVIAFLVLHNTPLGQNLGVGKATYTRADQQTLVPGNASQLIVKNQAGNILVNTDSGVSSASLASIKRVQASSQSDATTRFRSLKLITQQISQGADPSCTASVCLLITATVPSSSSSPFGGSNGDTIDLTITLPTSFSNPVSPYTLALNAIAGNITVNGFNGILNLNSTAGNISVAHNAVIFAGTCIQSTHGNITIGQGSFFDPNQSSSLIPCKNTTSSQTHAWFSINSGVGSVNIVLRADNTDLLLDAFSLQGKIHTGFGPGIPTAADGSSTYHGPLLAGTRPIASLYIIASTGDITIRKQ
jgi:hypothetical protein